MARNVYTVNVENEQNVTNENKKNVTKVKVKEDEFVCGVDMINNKSSKKRVNNKAELGYEKNVVSSAKKNVKSKFNHIDDYSDFTFKTTKVSAQKQTKVEENGVKVKESKPKEEPVLVKEKTTSVIKFVPEQEENERQSNIVAEVSDRFELDEDARKIVYVARMGSLFDYEKMF